MNPENITFEELLSLKESLVDAMKKDNDSYEEKIKKIKELLGRWEPNL